MGVTRAVRLGEREENRERLWLVEGQVFLPVLGVRWDRGMSFRLLPASLPFC